jgi:hypothetical protein
MHADNSKSGVGNKKAFRKAGGEKKHVSQPASVSGPLLLLRFTETCW